MTTQIQISATPPPDRDYIPTCDLAQCHEPDGTIRIAQKWVGRTKGREPMWALIPMLTPHKKDEEFAALTLN